MTAQQEFPFDPTLYGLPGREELIALRIWDAHYHGFLGAADMRQHEEMMFYVERLGIERIIAVDIGSSPSDQLAETKLDAVQRELLEREKDRISGIHYVDPSDPDGSCQKMTKWIQDGPCIGIKYFGTNRDGITCDHSNNDSIIRLAAELNALVYIHTWMKVGGDPRRPGGGNLHGESTPMDVARLAERFPEVPLICGHSGGDWELGVRAIRPCENVLLEFAGSDSHSGQIDYAVKHLGVERIVWGGHGPSRSYATELSKVLDADLTFEERRLILGGNLRRIAAPIFQTKGIPL